MHRTLSAAFAHLSNLTRCGLHFSFVLNMFFAISPILRFGPSSWMDGRMNGVLKKKNSEMLRQEQRLMDAARDRKVRAPTHFRYRYIALLN